MSNNELLAALALDLKRIALALHRDSPVAKRFMREALRWRKGILVENIPPHLRRIIHGLEATLSTSDDRLPEDLLMYSQLIQNYVIYH